MPTSYPPLHIGAPARLALFRREASQGKWARPMTWREVRFAKLNSAPDSWNGTNGASAVWYSFGALPFRSINYCDDVLRSIDHRGWFTDGESETARGIVARLPHGRFLAGYELSMNGEQVVYGELFDDEADAARMADEHARVIAEQESEYSERSRAALDLDDKIERALDRLDGAKQSLELGIAASRGAHEVTTRCAAWATRERARREAAELTASIRSLREQRAEYKDID